MKNRLKEIRRQQGKTLDQAAQAIGMTGAQVSRHENGERAFTFETLLDYAAFYNVGIDEIVDVPISGKRSAKFDELRMDTALGYIVEACDKHKLNADVRQVSKWAMTLYNNGINLRLTPLQMKGFADHIVHEAKDSAKADTTGKKKASH